MCGVPPRRESSPRCRPSGLCNAGKPSQEQREHDATGGELLSIFAGREVGRRPRRGGDRRSIPRSGVGRSPEQSRPVPEAYWQLPSSLAPARPAGEPTPAAWSRRNRNSRMEYRKLPERTRPCRPCACRPYSFLNGNRPSRSGPRRRRPEPTTGRSAESVRFQAGGASIAQATTYLNRLPWDGVPGDQDHALWWPASLRPEPDECRRYRHAPSTHAIPPPASSVCRATAADRDR